MAHPPTPRTRACLDRSALPLVLMAALSGCQVTPAAPLTEPTAPEAAALEARTAGLVRVSFPAQDPGPPFYARVSPYPELLNQVFSDGRTVAIPLYRAPSCIPDDFNLFQIGDPPSADGPGAFGCPLLVHGDGLIEAGAPPGTFPIHVVTKGPAQIWFVDHDEFVFRTADGILPMARLAGEFTSLRIGTADQFQEVLRPRFDPEHSVLIQARGRLEGGERFHLSVNHRGSTLRSIVIQID